MLWTKFNGNIQIKLQHVLNEKEIRSGIEKELTGQFHCWIKIILFHSIFKATVEFMQKWMGPPSGFSVWDALSSLNRIGLFAWLIMLKLLKNWTLIRSVPFFLLKLCLIYSKLPPYHWWITATMSALILLIATWISWLLLVGLLFVWNLPLLTNHCFIVVGLLIPVLLAILIV